MIVDERVSSYIESLIAYNSDFLEELREKALADNVPIIKRDTESFLKTLLLLKKPKRIQAIKPLRLHLDAALSVLILVSTVFVWFSYQVVILHSLNWRNTPLLHYPKT